MNDWELYGVPSLRTLCVRKLAQNLIKYSNKKARPAFILRYFSRLSATPPEALQELLDVLVARNALNDNILPHALTRQTQRLALEGASQLRRSILSTVGRSCPRLRVLDVRSCQQVDNRIVRDVLQYCERLESLRLDGCVRISDSAFAPALWKPPLLGLLGLSELSVGKCGQITTEGLMGYIMKGAPDMKMLGLASCRVTVTDDVVSELLFSFGLEALDLSFCTQITDAPFQARASSVLRKLHVAYTAISDAAAECIAEFAPCLESLDASCVMKFTDRGVIAIVKGCTMLRNLNISSTQVTDASFEAIARCSHLESLNAAWCLRASAHAIDILTAGGGSNGEKQGPPPLQELSLEHVGALGLDCCGDIPSPLKLPMSPGLSACFLDQLPSRLAQDPPMLLLPPAATSSASTAASSSANTPASGSMRPRRPSTGSASTEAEEALFPPLLPPEAQQQPLGHALQLTGTEPAEAPQLPQQVRMQPNLPQPPWLQAPPHRQSHQGSPQQAPQLGPLQQQAKESKASGAGEGLGPFRPPPPPSIALSLRSIAATFGPSLEQLLLGGVQGLCNAAALEAIADRCRSLRQLALMLGPDQDSDPAMEAALRAVGTRCGRLRLLRLDASSRRHQPVVAALAMPNFKELRSLTLWCSKNGGLQDAELEVILTGRTALESLSLRNCDGLSEGLFPRWCGRVELHEEADGLLDQVLLSSLSLGGGSFLAAEHLPRPETPHARRRRKHPSCPAAIALRSVTSFSLVGASALSDRSADALAELLRDAQSAELRGSPLLTRDAMRSFRHNCRFLRSVSIVTREGPQLWPGSNTTSEKKHRHRMSRITSGSSGTESN